MSESTSPTQQPLPDEAAEAAAPYNAEYLGEPPPPPSDEAAAPFDTKYLAVPGVRFVPSDQELLFYYLQPKLRGEEPPTDVVQADDVYVVHPKELTVKLGESLEGSWYVFSPRSRKYPNGMRPSRNTGEAGIWKATGCNDKILAGTDAEGRNQVIGCRRLLQYEEYMYDNAGRRRRMRRKTEWKMLEFVSSDSNKPIHPADDSMLLNAWVLCKIFFGKGVEKKTEEEKQPMCNPQEEDGEDATAALPQEAMHYFLPNGANVSDGRGDEFECHVGPEHWGDTGKQSEGDDEYLYGGIGNLSGKDFDPEFLESTLEQCASVDPATWGWDWDETINQIEGLVDRKPDDDTGSQSGGSQSWGC